MATDTDPSFRMPIVDVFAIAGRGTVAAGQIESGTIKIGDELFVNRTPKSFTGSAPTAESTKTHVIGLQIGPKIVREARQGDMVGVVLRGIKVEAMSAGDELSAVKAGG